jgi:hypothetical protein
MTILLKEIIEKIIFFVARLFPNGVFNSTTGYVTEKKRGIISHFF